MLLELPSTRHEAWRWSDLSKLPAHRAATPTGVVPGALPWLIGEGPRLLFVDGKYDASRSAPGAVTLGGVSLDGGVRGRAAAGVTELVVGAVQEWAARKGVTVADPLAACETCWGVLHGMACLGMLPDVGFGRAERHAANALSALMKSWEV